MSLLQYEKNLPDLQNNEIMKFILYSKFPSSDIIVIATLVFAAPSTQLQEIMKSLHNACV